MEVRGIGLGNVMSRKILGLDIRNDAVSAVLLRSGIREIHIEAHEHVPIPDQKEIESSIVSALETITEKIDTTGSICIASFPADRISYRNIRVPFKEQKKIRRILPFELEATLPFQVEDLVIDFRAVKFPDNRDHTDIVAAAVEKSGLKSYLQTLASFNIEPEIVTFGGCPAALCLAKLADVPEYTLFVDIDKEKSTLFALVSGQISLVRSFLINSDSSSASSRTKSLCVNIERTLCAFEEIFGFDFQPDEVLITGCGLDGSNPEDDMAKILELPVKRADLVSDTGLTIKNPAPWKPEQMDNAFSLALLEIEGIDALNFRKGPFAAKKYLAEHKKSLIKTGILAGLVLILIFFNVFVDTYSMEKKAAGLDQQITDLFKTTFPDVKKIVDPLHQMRVKIKDMQKGSLLPGETGTNILVIDILNDISYLIPKEIDVELTRLVMGAESVLITGDTDTFNSVDDIKSRLEQAEFFKKVTISSADIDRSENRVRFKLKVQL